MMIPSIRTRVVLVTPPSVSLGRFTISIDGVPIIDEVVVVLNPPEVEVFEFETESIAGRWVVPK